MEQQMEAAKQLIDMQRATFNMMMNNTNMFWNQTEQMLSSFLGMANWMPEEMKGAFKQWLEGNKQALELFRNTVEEGFNNLEKYIAEGKPFQFGYK